MSRRTTRLRAGMAACLVAVASACAPSAPAPPSAPSANVGTRLDAPVSRRIMTMPLRDSRGTVHRLADFKGRVLVISDGMTLCQEACPVDTAGLTETARRVDRAGLGRRVEFLTITVDPRRDTPARLAAYRKLFTPVPRNWMTLTGSAGEISALWKYFGVFTQRVPEPRPPVTDWWTGKPLTYDVDHSDEVFFLSGNGHERFVLEGTPAINHRTAVPAEIYRFMDAKGHANVKHPLGSAWTVEQALQVVGWLVGKRLP